MKRLVFGMFGVVMVAMAGSAGAYFTAQAQVPDNVISAGTLAVSVEPTAAAVSIDALAPGTTGSRQLTVVNSGALPASIVVTAVKKAGITDFFNALTCRVTAGGEPLYDGTLSALRTTPVVIEPGARTDLAFGIGLPATAGNDLAGDYTKISLYVDAEQAH